MGWTTLNERCHMIGASIPRLGGLHSVSLTEAGRQRLR